MLFLHKSNGKLCVKQELTIEESEKNIKLTTLKPTLRDFLNSLHSENFSRILVFLKIEKMTSNKHHYIYVWCSYYYIDFVHYM